jgi:hypothetical protein
VHHDINHLMRRVKKPVTGKELAHDAACPTLTASTKT